MGARKWQEPKSYTVLLKFHGGGSDETQPFLDDFETIKGCSYEVGKKEIEGMPDYRYVTLKIDHNQHRTKEIIEKEVVIRGGHRILRNDYTVAEVFDYCKSHNQQKAAEHFDIPYRSFQRYIAKVKARGEKPEDNWNEYNNDLFIREKWLTPSGAKSKFNEEER